MKLVIGNKRLSSWSLRPWLVLKHFNIPFSETLILLDHDDMDEKIAQYHAGQTVPILVDQELAVWDSLAICEYLNDRFPDKQMWPRDLMARARARSVSAEMHSGFATLRRVMSHDLQRQDREFKSHEALDDIARVKALWTECLKRSGGPYLFGDFTIADAMFAPVVNRFVSYAVPVDPQSETRIAQYLQTIRALPAHQEWIKVGEQETYIAKDH